MTCRPPSTSFATTSPPSTFQHPCLRPRSAPISCSSATCEGTKRHQRLPSPRVTGHPLSYIPGARFLLLPPPSNYPYTYFDICSYAITKSINFTLTHLLTHTTPQRRSLFQPPSTRARNSEKSTVYMRLRHDVTFLELGGQLA